MPPRVTRSNWPCLFPRHDPPPFPCPRWFATPRPGAGRRDQNQVPPESVAGVQRDEDAQTRTARPDTGKPEENDTVPIRRLVGKKGLVRRLEVKQKIRNNNETIRKELRSNFPDADDWRTPLAALRRHTPSDPHRHVKQLEQVDMPPGLRGYYKGDLHELFVLIYLHTGCHVQVTRDSRVDGPRFDALDLAGTRLSIDLARNMLDDSILITSYKEQTAKKSAGTRDVTASMLARPGVEPRSVWALRSQRRKLLAEVSKPRPWNTIDFACYIEDLVNSEASPKERRTSGDPFVPHVDQVTKRIMDVLPHTALSAFVSSHACAVAIQYLASHRKIPEIRHIIQTLDRLSVLISPQVFNVCLHAAAEACDMHTYNFLLHFMVDRKIQPDHDSWAALVSLVQARSPRDTKHVISAMRTRGLLASHAAKIAVANAVIKVEFAEWLARDDPPDEFISHYDRVWGGPEWLDPRCANVMLGMLALRADFQHAFELLQVLNKRRRQPNIVSLNILLQAAALCKDIPTAQAALKLLLPNYKRLRPNANTFKQLAYLAVRNRAHNLLRVVWRHACMTGQTSWKLILQIESSLLSTPLSHGSSANVGSGTGDDSLGHATRKAHFMAVAGKLAVGVGKRHRTEDFDATTEEVQEATADAEPDAEKATPPSTRDRSRQRLLRLLHQDMSSSRFYRPVLPLADAFSAAAKLDAEWALLGMRKSLDLGWMLDNAVEVEVEAK